MARRRACIFALIALGFASPVRGDTGFFSLVGRHLGWGWSAGYHACEVAPGCVPAAGYQAWGAVPPPEWAPPRSPANPVETLPAPPVPPATTLPLPAPPAVPPGGTGRIRQPNSNLPPFQLAESSARPVTGAAAPLPAPELAEWKTLRPVPLPRIAPVPLPPVEGDNRVSAHLPRLPRVE